MNRHFFIAALATALCVGGTAQAAKIQLSEDSSINLAYLLQVQGQFAEDNAVNGQWGSDFFIRRSRILLFGDLTKNISFFMETDSPNFGKDGNFDADFYLQDAFMSFKVVNEFVVDAGLILIPLSHHAMQGAIAMNTLDYHSALIKYPGGSTKVWRDLGVQIRGLALKDKLHWRVGVFNGIEGKTDSGTDANGVALPSLNSRDLPRFAGTVRYSILGTEPKFFYNGINFGTEPILSVGVGFDFQPDIIRVPDLVDVDGNVEKYKLDNYGAASADLFLDIPIGPNHEILFQTNFLYFYQGEKAANTGMGFFTEFGYRFMFFGPVLSYERFYSDKAESDYEAIHAGMNFWIKQHNANVKIDAGMARTGVFKMADLSDFKTTITVQSQLFF